jgi:hypothetical protein
MLSGLYGWVRGGLGVALNACKDSSVKAKEYIPFLFFQMKTPYLRTPSERFGVMRRQLLLFVLSDGKTKREKHTHMTGTVDDKILMLL